MKTRRFQDFALMLAVAGQLTLSAYAGTFKNITIDGSYADWSGVPLAYTQAQDVTNFVAYKDIYMCNDADYLYVRFTIYPPADNPFNYLENIFIDTDQNSATGY